jgi:DNA polymerase elongation subunit (family B)
LIDKRFKTLQNIYTQALYCREKIGLAFSKIAVSEALVFNYFYDNGIKVIPERKHDVERGNLVGAYVRTPTPGKHKYVCCNDFASLYPSTIITCNLSFENFIGTFYDYERLRPYIENHNEYIVIGGNVHKNDGTYDKPRLGDMVGRFLDEATLDVYRSDPRYFVSVNGHVYDNDKDYAFKTIQATLKANRNSFKYLAKGLYADVMSDVENIMAGHTVKSRDYKEEYVKAMKEIGYDVKRTADLSDMDLYEFKPKLATLIEFYTSYEQAMKLLGNSMYGGSSHISFFWFNMGLANDITGEARNVIKLMENHIPEYIRTEWPKMTDVHKALGIKVIEPQQRIC